MLSHFITVVEISLQDRPAIVTGASRGIGRAIAEQFTAAGGDVVVCSRSMDRIGPVADQLSDDHEGRAIPVECDVTDEDDVRNLVDVAVKELGDLRVLVNNAGGGGSAAALLHRADPAEYRRMLELNLVSAYRVTHEALPAMVAAGGGSIVHIGSVNGLFGIGLAGYSEAKSGMLALSRNLAAHYGQHGIRSNVVSAGTIETESRREEMADTEDRADDARSRWLDQYPVGRFGTPQEVADTVLFLASERSGFITGANVVVDGGLSCGLSTSFVDQIYQADDPLAE
jgi:3-oxoacyl-[acyl-carrier protein] reductase